MMIIIMTGLFLIPVSVSLNTNITALKLLKAIVFTTSILTAWTASSVSSLRKS